MAYNQPGPRNIAPNPQYPEKPHYVYERSWGPEVPGNRGPLRFEEGVATDTDVPDEFMVGMMQGYQTAPGRPNHNMKVDTKWPQETISQRVHVGSAAWVEAPTFLSEFAQGAFTDRSEVEYEQVNRSGGHYMRLNPSVVED